MALHPSFITTPIGMAVGLALTRIIKSQPKWYHYLTGGGLGAGAGYGAGELLNRLPKAEEGTGTAERKAKEQLDIETQQKATESQETEADWQRALGEEKKKEHLKAHPEISSEQYAQEEEAQEAQLIRDAIKQKISPEVREKLWGGRHEADPRTVLWEKFRKAFPIHTLPQDFQRAMIAYKRKGGIDPYKLFKEWYPAEKKPKWGWYGLHRPYAATSKEKMKEFRFKHVLPKSILDIGSPFPDFLERGTTRGWSWLQKPEEAKNYGGAIPGSAMPPFKHKETK